MLINIFRYYLSIPLLDQISVPWKRRSLHCIAIECRRRVCLFYIYSQTGHTDARPTSELRFPYGGDHVVRSTWQQRSNQRLRRLLQLVARWRHAGRCPND